MDLLFTLSYGAMKTARRKFEAVYFSSDIGNIHRVLCLASTPVKRKSRMTIYPLVKKI